MGLRGEEEGGVDVMAVIVVATSVTRQDPHKASEARHIKIKEETAQT